MLLQIQKLDDSWQQERAGLKEKLERLQKVYLRALKDPPIVEESHFKSRNGKRICKI